MSSYSEAHQAPTGPGDARPTALQIIQDEGLEGNMKDKVFLITGCSSGIGIETARALAATGARCFLAVRSLEKGQTACSAFPEPDRVELLQCDTSSMSSVRAAAAAFLAKSSTLNVLVCNAGIMQLPEREEVVGILGTDGRPESFFETQLATNYLGHFLLFHCLKDAMLRAAEQTPGFRSRLVQVSSSVHYASEMAWGDLNLRAPGAYTPMKGYAQSKLAQIYHANYVDRIYGAGSGDGDGRIHGLTVMPGGVLTAISSHLPEEARKQWTDNEKLMAWTKSFEQGAATTAWAAVGKELEGVGGKYLEDCAVSSNDKSMPGFKGYADFAFDGEKEERLWGMTMQMLKLE
ncbi:short chain dehydrogenase [Apiospora arundinis]|uniref:Short chain dehydrogenase n=1 Tax=Apiospora arundinis TaxID=335852 RepID=A0ABR2III4_9PEZI